MNKKRSFSDVLIIGFALFAMFFGAGNLIFPPALGLMSGNQWITGFILYFIADIGLAAFTVYALIGTGGKAEIITEPLGSKPSRIIITTIILCIGPCFGIPRTAATTYELGIVPLLGIEASKLGLAAFSVIFFAVVLFISIKPNKVVDVIGKVLTPVLLIATAIMIVKGILSPPALIGAPQTTNVVKEGIYNGYQTMDMLASLAFTAIIIESIKNKGYNAEKDIKKITINSTFVSIVLLFFIYGGLTYLGATCEGATRRAFFDGFINQASLLTAIIKNLLGFPGLIIIAIVVAFACLTTAIGLTSAAADYFQGITKLSYKRLVIICCVVSMLICNLSLSQIIIIAAPILQIVYPVAVLMIFTFFLRKKITNVLPYRISVVVALITSCIEVAADTFNINIPAFTWVIPSALAFLITCVVLSLRKLSANTTRHSS